ncbi:hypothetical protein IF129_18800 [Streptomyces chumphonensis]|uniref:DUF6542 domain-containing protein n=1 Tax=Streptomyces chumphonensis TaxID=1214925 RepID=A0A927F0X5_9ACTN|nr:DUF6542 domain-containing protein [Streptomyces chumphonensis]MBD3933595.1 hypothetical protein [Streptomyces chumphonensis]
MTRLAALRLTALGGGLLTITAMVLLAGLARLLLDASTAVYGGCFLVVGLASVVWVRPADVFTAPVVAPIAYAAGLVLLTGGSGGGGFGERVMTVVTALAVEAAWVYGGTLATALAALARRATLAAAKRRAREAAARRTAGPKAQKPQAQKPQAQKPQKPPGPRGAESAPPRSRRPAR